MLKNTYFWLFTLASMVYVLGLDITVMDVDSAQYASISREMAETGNYLQVQHRGMDYLDKPPLLFWVNALLFSIFGVADWVFKLGSFLFTILGVYSTFRLGKILYNAETGRLAALLLYTCQAFFLFNNDVRTDTMLTSAVVFAIWQMTEWLHNRKWKWLIGGAVGIALAMLAKGPVGLMVPVLALGSYILGRKSWKDLYRWQYLVLVLIVAVLLSPMLYGLYQQFDAQPEKTTLMVSPDGLREEKGVSGLKFYLWTQSFGRITGENVWEDTSGPFFFVHNFLWSYLPWAFLFIFAFFTRIRQAFLDLIWAGRVPEMLTSMGFLLPFIILSMSSYKLPHYIFVLYPLASILTAWWWNEKVFGKNKQHPWLVMSMIFQTLIAVASGILVFFIQFRFFPGTPVWITILTIVGFAAGLYALITFRRSRLHLIIGAALISITLNLTMNAHFYPSIMLYQAGNQVADYVNKRQIDPEELFFFNTFSYSLGYYVQHSILVGTYDVLNDRLDKGESAYLLTTEEHLDQLRSDFNLGTIQEFNTFKVTRLSMKVLMPDQRKNNFEKFYLVQIKARK